MIIMMGAMVLRAMLEKMVVMTVIMVTMVMWVGVSEGNINVVAVGKLSMLVILFTLTQCILDSASSTEPRNSGYA